MTVKVNSGSIVEDTYKTIANGSEVTEAYVWTSVLKDLAYSFRDSIESSDSDLENWIEFLKNVEIEGESLGAVQAVATDFTTSDYLDQMGLDSAIPTTEASDIEAKIAKRLTGTLSERNTELVDLDNPQVPTTPDGEAMPMFVATNERSKGLHTFEEATAMWSKFMDHLGVEVTNEPTESDDSDDSPDKNPSSESSDEDEHWLHDVNGVGSEVFGRIKERAVSEQESFHYGELLSDEEVTAIREADVIVTTEEAQERLQGVAAEMPTGAFSMASDKIAEGEIEEAITLIADYE